MLRLRVSLLMMVITVSPVFSQTFPDKPIRMVAPEAGGGADIVVRLIAQGLARSLNQPVIIDNRGGGGGLIAVQIVSSAPPDGYTLLFSGSNIWTLPLMQKVSHDPVRDFSPVTLADKAPNILAVHPSVSAKTVGELITLAKARPGELNYGSSGSGTANHLAAELFKSMAGVNIVRIPYKGSAPALNDVVAGQVHMMFATTAAVAPHVKSGRLRALAVTSAQPSALAPELPTIAASGLPGYEAETTHGVFVPAQTPALLINRLHQEIVRILNLADVKERLFNAGIEVVGNAPREFAATIKSEMAKLGKVIRDAGIRAD